MNLKVPLIKENTRIKWKGFYIDLFLMGYGDFRLSTIFFLCARVCVWRWGSLVCPDMSYINFLVNLLKLKELI